MKKKIAFNTVETFWIHVDRSAGPDSCWNWLLSRNGQGYGQFSYQNKMVRAHRFAWLLMFGELPLPPLQLDHICRNRGCVNPAHLRPVTNRENTLAGISAVAKNAKKTHCPVGHALIESNLIPSKLKKGHRICRTCENERDSRRYYENHDSILFQRRQQRYMAHE